VLPGLLVALLALGGSGVAGAVIVEDVRVYVEGDSLLLDARMDSLFSPRVLDALESGMTTSLAVTVRLDRARSPAARALLVRIDHDIWEGRYRVVRETTPPDTLETDSFAEMARRAGTIDRLFVGLAIREMEHVLRLRASVDPISREQRERTRRWLNLLSRGSLLELFINLEPSPDEEAWIDLARFRPEDLPSNKKGAP
jgi:hypothetical protein